MGLEMRIKWLVGDAKGTVEVLPVNLFKKLTTHFVKAHEVEFRRGKDFAKFTARIQPRWAMLDYTLHEPFNVARGMELGRLELEFVDEAREELKAVIWEDRRQGPGRAVFGTVSIGKPVPPHLRATGWERTIGAGFGTSEHNLLAERAAIKAVQARLIAEGWTVRSVEKEKPGYDLEAFNGKKYLHVEVKGIQGAKVSFILTSRERKRAVEDPEFQLFAVTNALSKPSLHRYSGADIERRFVFSPLQWMLNQV